LIDDEQLARAADGDRRVEPHRRTIAKTFSVSLYGFVTGLDPDLEHGLGVGGEPLHTWADGSDDPVDAEVLRDSTGQIGAVVPDWRSQNA